MSYDAMRRRQPVVPVIAYQNLEHALAWLTLTFKFRERLRQYDERGRVVWAEMRAGAGDVMVRRVEERDSATPGASHVVVYIDEVQTHYEDAVYAAFRSRGELRETPEGLLEYDATDPEGNRWTFCELLRDIDPRQWGAVLADEQPPRPDPVTATPEEWVEFETARQLLEPPVRLTGIPGAPGAVFHQVTSDHS